MTTPRDERGQALVFTVLVLTVMLGAAMIIFSTYKNDLAIFYNLISTFLPDLIAR